MQKTTEIWYSTQSAKNDADNINNMLCFYLKCLYTGGKKFTPWANNFTRRVACISGKSWNLTACCSAAVGRPSKMEQSKSNEQMMCAVMEEDRPLLSSSSSFFDVAVFTISTAITIRRWLIFAHTRARHCTEFLELDNFLATGYHFFQRFVLNLKWKACFCMLYRDRYWQFYSIDLLV